jgi:hypothetical protein
MQWGGQMMTQVPSDHYSATGYDEWHRWVSYWYQIRAAMRAAPSSVLEIGVGTRVVSHYLTERLAYDVTTFDFDASLSPHVVGDVRELEQHFAPDTFDCVCAFQVLEHLPYEDFLPTLTQLNRVARRSVLISLPHWGAILQFRIRVLRLRWCLVWGRKFTPPHTWTFDGEHYWEIGTRGYALKKVIRDIRQVLDIERHYFCPDYPYHYFFECRVK